MRRIFASQDPTAIAIVRELLDNEGIPTRVLNQNMAAVSGGVPYLLAMPEVWATRDEDEPRARSIVERFESGEARPQRASWPWTCPGCGETLDGQFTSCWKCGTPRG